MQPMLRYPHTREVLVGVAHRPDLRPGDFVRRRRRGGRGGARHGRSRCRRSTRARARPDGPDARATACSPATATCRRPTSKRSRGCSAASRAWCARCPGSKEMDLNPVLAHPGGAIIADARVAAATSAARRKLPRRAGAIRTSPSIRTRCELEGELRLRDGTRAARAADPPGGRGARAALLPRPVRALALPALHAASARAAAAHARALHPARLRPRARAGRAHARGRVRRRRAATRRTPTA